MWNDLSKEEKLKWYKHAILLGYDVKLMPLIYNYACGGHLKAGGGTQVKLKTPIKRSWGNLYYQHVDNNGNTYTTRGDSAMSVKLDFAAPIYKKIADTGYDVSLADPRILKAIAPSYVVDLNGNFKVYPSKNTNEYNTLVLDILNMSAENFSELMSKDVNVMKKAMNFNKYFPNMNLMKAKSYFGYADGGHLYGLGDYLTQVKDYLGDAASNTLNLLKLYWMSSEEENAKFKEHLKDDIKAIKDIEKIRKENKEKREEEELEKFKNTVAERDAYLKSLDPTYGEEEMSNDPENVEREIEDMRSSYMEGLKNKKSTVSKALESASNYMHSQYPTAMSFADMAYNIINRANSYMPFTYIANTLLGKKLAPIANTTLGMLVQDVVNKLKDNLQLLPYKLAYKLEEGDEQTQRAIQRKYAELVAKLLPEIIEDLPEELKQIMRYMIQNFEKKAAGYNPNSDTNGFDSNMYKAAEESIGNKGSYAGASKGSVFNRSTSAAGIVENTIGLGRLRRNEDGSYTISDIYDFNDQDKKNLDKKDIQKAMGHLASWRDIALTLAHSDLDPDNQKMHYKVNLGKPEDWNLENMEFAPSNFDKTFSIGDYAPKEKTKDIQKQQVKQKVKQEVKQEVRREIDNIRRNLEKTKTAVAQKGDSLWKIAKAAGTTVSELRKLNPDIKGDLIKIGQKIKLR